MKQIKHIEIYSIRHYKIQQGINHIFAIRRIKLSVDSKAKFKGEKRMHFVTKINLDKKCYRIRGGGGVKYDRVEAASWYECNGSS